MLISNFGRALNITKRIAGRLPQEAPVLELDVTDDEHLAGLEAQVREHVDGLDGVVHAIAYGNPATILGDKFLTGPWEDVAQAVRVSAYSYQSLATACLPLMGGGGSIVGCTFDAQVAWPGYDWMGFAKGALESANRYLARDLGPKNISQPGVHGSAESLAAKCPGLRAGGRVGETCADRLDQTDFEPTAHAIVALLSDFIPKTTGEIVHVDPGGHAMGA